MLQPPLPQAEAAQLKELRTELKTADQRRRWWRGLVKQTRGRVAGVLQITHPPGSFADTGGAAEGEGQQEEQGTPGEVPKAVPVTLGQVRGS